MKKSLLLIGLLSYVGIAEAQTFTDNFDSYTAGQKLGPQSGGAWTTWSNAPGGAEDVDVINTDAASAPNSLRFTSTSSTGGPVDVVRHFGVLSTGQFSMEFNMKVPSGKAAYFNLQKTATMGQTYALDTYFNDNGTLTFSQIAGFSANYPQGSWFNFRMDINFNINKWEIFINDVSVGYFSNAVNQIEAIDLFPVDANSPYSADFYVDDFQTVITPYVLPNLNAGVTYAGFNGGNIATNDVTPSFKIKNLGTTTITSFDIEVDYNGSTINQSYTGLSIASLAEQSFTTTDLITLVAGSNPLQFTVSNVNMLGADDDAADDVSSVTVTPVVPAVGKMVVGEEATGSWCQWCPRGAVYMDLFENDYEDFWAGIAVHNGDPMTVTEYDTEISALVGGGYPNAVVDRGAAFDPSDMGTEFFTRLQVAPKAFITNGATWDAGTRVLNVSVSADFQTATTGNYRLAVVLTEDDVTGTTSGYNQSNAYAGGASGVMGGYELLSNPVPAAQMVYDHVARAIEPSFDGDPLSIPAVTSAGQVHTSNYQFTLPASWDEDEIHIIGMLIDPSGRIDNAGKAKISEAVSNGFVADADLSISEMNMEQIDDAFKVYPNPATTSATVIFTVDQESQVDLKLLDMSGKVISAKNYGTANGSSQVDLNTSKLTAGFYLVELTVNSEVFTKRLVIQ